MEHPLQLAIFLGVAACAWGAAWVLRRRDRAPVGTVLTAAAAFTGALFLLKVVPLVLPEEGFLRDDGLFPLWALWDRPHAPLWAIPAVAIGAALAAAAGSRWTGRLPRPAFALLAVAGAVALWTSLALVNGGPSAVVAPFRRDADYWADVERFESLGEVWRTYVARQDGLSLHGRTHPPGALLVLWPLAQVWGGRLVPVCAAVIGLGALGALPVLALARACLDEAGARAATLLWVLTPGVALYGATSMDMVFAVPLVAAAAAFAKGLRDGGSTPGLPAAAGWGAAAGGALAAGALCTFSAALLAVSFVLAGALVVRRLPGQRARIATLVATAGATCLGLLLTTRALGFDWFACLDRARLFDAEEHPATLSASYWIVTRLMGVLDALLLASPAAAALWLGGMRRRAFAAPAGETGGRVEPRLIGVALSRAAAVSVAAFLLLGVYKIGETGRILLFLLPLPALLSVARLERAWPAWPAWSRGAVALAVLALAQALLFELALDTRW